MVDDVHIKLNTTEFTNALSGAGEELKQLMYERMISVSEFVEAEAVEEAPSDTGNLRQQMFNNTIITKSQIKGIIGNRAEYAAYVHQGTGKYAAAGNGRKTPWRVTTIYKGEPVEFWTRGQKPNPFLTRAIEKNMGHIKKVLGVE